MGFLLFLPLKLPSLFPFFLVFCWFLIKAYQNYINNALMTYVLTWVVLLILSIYLTIHIMICLLHYYCLLFLIFQSPLILFTIYGIQQEVCFLKDVVYLDYELYLEDLDGW